MAWLAIEEDGEEYIFSKKPQWDRSYWRCDTTLDIYEQDVIPLPRGSIEKLTSKVLMQKDGPFEYK